MFGIHPKLKCRPTISRSIRAPLYRGWPEVLATAIAPFTPGDLSTFGAGRGCNPQKSSRLPKMLR
jgi:hypothetical protein